MLKNNQEEGQYEIPPGQGVPFVKNVQQVRASTIVLQQGGGNERIMEGMQEGEPLKMLKVIALVMKTPFL